MANLRVDKITSTETFETTGSVQLDRSGDYLQVDLGSGLGDNFTIEFWILGSGIASEVILQECSNFLTLLVVLKQVV